MKYHKTKSGVNILIKDMSDDHLINVIAMIKRKAKNGLKVFYAGGYVFDVDSLYYDEDIIYGKAVLKKMNYKSYKNEANRRGIAYKNKFKNI